MKLFWSLALMPHKQVNKDTDTEWGYKVEDNTLYLSFQGSTSKEDWKQNFNFLKVPYKNMPKKFRVHKGFLIKWKSIEQDVLKLVTKNITKVIIAGFSQGGAVSLLAHESIFFHFERLQNNIFTYAFGTPRVFSWNVPKERFKNVTYIQYGGDIVTGVPFTLMGYKHVNNNRVQLIPWPNFLRIGAWQHLKYFKYYKEN